MPDSSAEMSNVISPDDDEITQRTITICAEPHLKQRSGACVAADTCSQAEQTAATTSVVTSHLTKLFCHVTDLSPRVRAWFSFDVVDSALAIGIFVLRAFEDGYSEVSTYIGWRRELLERRLAIRRWMRWPSQGEMPGAVRRRRR
jgi:hypothetical protein